MPVRRINFAATFLFSFLNNIKPSRTKPPTDLKNWIQIICSFVAAQYEIDFEQEFRHYLYMGKHKNQRFNDLLNVVDQTPLKLADIPESLYVSQITC